MPEHSKDLKIPAAFLAKDWASEVELIRPVPRDIVTRGKNLVRDVTVDLDKALLDDEA